MQLTRSRPAARAAVTENAQLDKLKGDKKVYDREVRPRLMVEAIHELQDAGVEPDLWKVEGLDRRDDCKEIGRHKELEHEPTAVLVGEKIGQTLQSSRLSFV
jgi:myo-inositol catabolism protein IolC